MVWRQLLDKYFEKCLNERAEIFGENNFNYAKIILENSRITWSFFSKNRNKIEGIRQKILHDIRQKIERMLDKVWWFDVNY